MNEIDRLRKNVFDDLQIIEEIDKLTAESTEWESKCYKLQNIIDKAIEYITKNPNEELSVDSYYKFKDISEFDDLLNILEGEYK